MIKIQTKAKQKLNKIKSLLNTAAQGKSVGDDLSSDLFIDDAAQLIKYYNYVAKGKFKKAQKMQELDMDTATYELIDGDIFDYIQDIER